MSAIFRRARTVNVAAALGGLALVLPLMVLESLTATGEPRTRFAAPLFVFLWVLAVVFVRSAISIVGRLQGVAIGVSRPSSLLLSLAVLMGAGWVWVSWVVDQWPCFLGASGC